MHLKFLVFFSFCLALQFQSNVPGLFPLAGARFGVPSPCQRDFGEVTILLTRGELNPVFGLHITSSTIPMQTITMLQIQPMVVGKKV